MEKYKVIADSGSTKTDWVIIDQKGEVVEKIKTIGFNPYFQTSEQIFNYSSALMELRSTSNK